MRAAIYVRCSTTNKKKFGDVSAYLQNPEAQVEPLVSLLASRGWELHQVYSDRMSGAKESRPGLQALTADARELAKWVLTHWNDVYSEVDFCTEDGTVETVRNPTVSSSVGTA